MSWLAVQQMTSAGIVGRMADVIGKLQFMPRLIDRDSTTGEDGVTYSLAIVNEVETYIVPVPQTCICLRTT